MFDLSVYASKNICVAVSGGRDSMALINFIYTHMREFGITLSALNCDHKLRGASSARDSAFVREWCADRKIPLIFFEKDGLLPANEALARMWRLKCYISATKDYDGATNKSIELSPSGIFTCDGKWKGVDTIATAHHLNDNAETVLFNLARGSALSGLDGITDGKFPLDGDKWLNFIRPMVSVSREEIDLYIKENNIPYVDDETNFADDYTRNKIRHNVLPELERAVPGAAKSIYRFSRLAAEDEQYFQELIEKRKLITDTRFGKKIALCEERVVFKRAAVSVIKNHFNRTDYTSEHAEQLYNLQFANNGKKFEFLNLTAYKDNGGVTIVDSYLVAESEYGREFKFHFGANFNIYLGHYIKICNKIELAEELDFIKENAEKDERFPQKIKTLKFDADTIPEGAVIRFMKRGDKFKKFGGGTKSLGDYFTDKKIPLWIRGKIPLIADGSEVLAVCGVEISDKIKITDNTKNTAYIIGCDYTV